MIYRYKISKETLLKLKLVVFVLSLIVGIVLLVISATSSSEYPIVGYLMAVICFIISIVSLSSYSKIKKQNTKSTENKNKINQIFSKHLSSFFESEDKDVKEEGSKYEKK